MAKHKQQIKFERPIVPKSIKKQKRNRKVTECNVIRRSTGCGICGSENIMRQGVRYCTECGKEVIIFSTETYFWRYDESDFCECVFGRKVKNRVHKSKPYKTIGILKCMDCGAVMANYCPNCKLKHRQCWKSSNGQLYCRTCGFRN